MAALGGCGGDVLTYSKDFQYQGLQQYKAGQYQQAEGSFSASVKQDPTNYVSEYYLGRCYEATNDYHEAIVAYKLSLELMQQTPAGRADTQLHDECVNHLVQTIGSSDQAGPEIDAMLADAAKNQDAQQYAMAARVLALRGDADTAIDTYRKALAIAPDDFDINKRFGLYLVKLNQMQLAQPVLQHAAQLRPGDKDVTAALAQAGAGTTPPP